MTEYQKKQYNNEQQHDQQEEQQYRSTSNTTSSTHSQACTPDGLIMMQIERMIGPAYDRMFGRFGTAGSNGIPEVIAEYFFRLLKAGMEPEVITHAIKQTAWARIPTPFYMRAILQRYLEEGIMTMHQLDVEKIERDRRRAVSRNEIEELMYPEL